MPEKMEPTTIRLTAGEKVVVRTDAKNAGLKFNAYVRTCLGLTTGSSRPQEIHETLRDLDRRLTELEERLSE